MRLSTTTSVLVLSLFAACSSESAPAGAGGGGATPAATPADPLAPPVGLEKQKLVTPADNELTTAKAELGKKLFFDPRMSASGEMACTACHLPEKAFTDGQKVSRKDSGKMNSRNSPTMYNLGYHPMHYWDGRMPGLEAVTKAAWTGQLGGKPEAVAEKLNAIDAYQQEFQAAFGADASETTIVQALSSFLRTLRTGNSAYDRFQAGDKSALTAEQKQGHDLFMGKAGCMTCHVPPLFTDMANNPAMAFHYVGIGMDAEKPDLGRGGHTKQAADNGKFKTPTLRDVTKTAPYFHDGSVTELRDAVKIMASGGLDFESRGVAKEPMLMPRNLTDAEIDQLVAFLSALEGDVAFTAPKLPQ